MRCAPCVREGAQGEVLEAVNYNSPGQIVIAGNRAAVERGMELAKAKGAKRAIMLPMSVPSHCRLLQGAARTTARLPRQCCRAKLRPFRCCTMPMSRL